MNPLFTAEQNNNYDPPWMIRVDPTPGGKENADGSRSFSLAFPFLRSTEWVGNPEKVMAKVADILNKHWSDEDQSQETTK